jgi:hypothetical protein
MADWIDLSLWGYAPDGRIRVGSAIDRQPVSVMTDQEIREIFDRNFAICPIRPYSHILEVVPKVLARCPGCGAQETLVDGFCIPCRRDQDRITRRLNEPKSWQQQLANMESPEL